MKFWAKVAILVLLPVLLWAGQTQDEGKIRVSQTGNQMVLMTCFALQDGEWHQYATLPGVFERSVVLMWTYWEWNSLVNGPMHQLAMIFGDPSLVVLGVEGSGLASSVLQAQFEIPYNGEFTTINEAWRGDWENIYKKSWPPDLMMAPDLIEFFCTTLEVEKYFLEP